MKTFKFKFVGKLTTRNSNLGHWRCVQRSLNRFHSLIENTRDAISLDEDGTIADTETETDANTQQGTRNCIGRCQNHETHAVATENAS